MTRPLDDNIHELAGEYVLGTLSTQKRLDVQRRLSREPDLQAAVDAWEQRLLPLTELAEPVTPSPGLWGRIERNLLDMTAPANTPQRPRVRWWDNLSIWRGLAGAGLAASLVLGMTLLTRAPAQPSYLVVLVGPQDKLPAGSCRPVTRRKYSLSRWGCSRFRPTRRWSSGPRVTTGKARFR